MRSRASPPDLWSLVRGTPWIDPGDLIAAIDGELRREPHDFRTRLLLRDSLAALKSHWGDHRVMSMFSESAKAKFSTIISDDLGQAGFPTLEQRLMERTDPQTILQFLRELGSAVHESTHIDVGGSGALILAGYLDRRTEDLDAVDEVPAALRSQHDVLNSMAARYGLRLTHFQSHYLPANWSQRTRSLGKFGSIDVSLVDVYDIFLSKLFSNRDKDRDDLRAMEPALDKQRIVDRLRDSAAALLASEPLRRNGERNWYIVFGEPLPAER